jgi:hypothetical protein
MLLIHININSDVCRLAQTSCNWRTLCEADDVWLALCTYRWNGRQTVSIDDWNDEDLRRRASPATTSSSNNDNNDDKDKDVDQHRSSSSSKLQIRCDTDGKTEAKQEIPKVVHRLVTSLQRVVSYAIHMLLIAVAWLVSMEYGNLDTLSWKRMPNV